MQEYTGLELYNKKVEEIPKLLDPFLHKVGVGALVGGSDTGKSTFLRQLSVCIALGMDEFIGYTLKPTHKKVIYVSTEEEPNTVSFSLEKQVNYLRKKYKLKKDKDLNPLANLLFIFDTSDLINKLKKKLNKGKVDLIVIDAFSDVFTKELNANTQVRSFINEYDQLAKKYKCLIIFLHHLTKQSERRAPSKNSVIGTQGFEAKMRVVLEIRPMKYSNANKLPIDTVGLIVLKANLLGNEHKKKARLLKFTDFIFENTNKTASIYSLDEKLKKGKNTSSTTKISKSKKASLPMTKDPKIKAKIKEFRKKGISFRNIPKEMKKIGITISKTTVEKIYNQ